MKQLTEFPRDYAALGGDPQPVLDDMRPVWGWIAEVSAADPPLEHLAAGRSFEAFLTGNADALGDIGVKIEIVSRVMQLSAHGVHMVIDFSETPWITTITEPDMGKYSGPPAE